MRKIAVITMVSLDGVMQAPGGPEEDRLGGFEYGGWTAPYGDAVGTRMVQKELAQQVDYLLGRKTFEIWEKYWPAHADMWPGINKGAKYVLSKTRKKPDWGNSFSLKIWRILESSSARWVATFGYGGAARLFSYC